MQPGSLAARFRNALLNEPFSNLLDLQDTRRGQNNADGFGIGFYTDQKLGAAPCPSRRHRRPGIARTGSDLASKTASHLIFAHASAPPPRVRLARTIATLLPRQPDVDAQRRPWGWKRSRGGLGERLADKWYLGVVGGTDSEWAFALFLDTLERMGFDSSSAAWRKALVHTCFGRRC